MKIRKAPTRGAARTLLTLTAVLAAACADSGPVDARLSPDAAANMDIVAGDGQTGLVGEQLPDPLVVRVTDGSGNPVQGQIVNFKVTEGGGTVFAGAGLTNAQGLAQEYLTLGPNAGRHQVEARAVHSGTGEKLLFDVFTATAVTEMPVATVSVSPSSASLTVGGTRQLSATARDADGNTLSRTFTWSSSNASVATVSSSGLVTARAAGSATITATTDGRSGTATVTVTQATQADTVPPAMPGKPSLTVSPVNADSFQVLASWTGVADAARYNWSTGTESGPSWSRSGSTTGTSVNFRAPQRDVTFWICLVAEDEAGNESASNCNRYSPPEINEEPTVTTVSVSPSSASLTVGGTRQLSATARDADGNTLSRTFTWSSSNASVATVSSSGLVTARAAGSATITATTDGRSGTASVDVTRPTSDSATPFFADDFDNGQKNDANGFRWTGAGVPVTTERAHSGSHSLRFRYSDVGDHLWAEQRFALGRNVDELWVEFWIYYPTNYVHGGNGGSENNKFFRLWGDSYDALNKVGASTWPGTGDASNLSFDYTKDEWHCCIGPGDSPSTTWGDDSMLGRWTQVRLHYRYVSGPGAADAVMQMWRNGTLVLDFRNVDQKYVDPAYWNTGYLLGYDNSGFEEETVIYIDDVKFWSSNPGW